MSNNDYKVADLSLADWGRKRDSNSPIRNACFNEIKREIWR